MSKKAIIFHGTGGNPNICWYPWLKARLESRGFTVSVPFYPGINQELIQIFLPKVMSEIILDESTILIGHSGGAPLILSILENAKVKIKQAILVAGYSTPPNTEEEPVLQEIYDWEKIKSNVRDIYFINSTNDPYGCDDKQGRDMFDKLGGTLIIKNEGHFGAPGQEYSEFELLNKLIN
jgi:predicted alpha/beta hydrolase family esterase